MLPTSPHVRTSMGSAHEPNASLGCEPGQSTRSNHTWSSIGMPSTSMPGGYPW